jgi:hypothetical protein
LNHVSGPAPARRLRTEADVNLPTPPAKSVENDPEPMSGPCSYASNPCSPRHPCVLPWFNW